MSKLFIKIKILMYTILRYFFYFFPTKRTKILFTNFNGNGYGDNPKYIYLSLLSLHHDWNYVWWIKDTNKDAPKDAKIIKRKIQLMYHLSTSKVIVNNVKNELPFIKKRKQFYLQTWHGGLSFKPVEKDAEAFLSQSYINSSKKESKIIDAIISDNSIQTNIFRSYFYLKDSSEILEYGCPKLDALFNADIKKINEVKRKIGIEQNKKIIVYAPTFRDLKTAHDNNLDYKSILEALNTNNEWVLLIRFHPNLKKTIEVSELGKDIIDVSDYPDAQDIWLVSDSVISDYSTVPFEFMLVNKPAFFYCPDKKGTVRVYDSFYNLGFNINNTEQQLINDIKTFNIEEYLKKVENFKEKVVFFNRDGNSSKRVALFIDSIVKNKKWRSKNIGK